MEKLVIIEGLKDLIRKFPQYSFGEILYGVLRPQGEEDKSGKVSDIYKLTNSEIIRRIENFKEIEEDE